MELIWASLSSTNICISGAYVERDSLLLISIEDCKPKHFQGRESFSLGFCGGSGKTSDIR